MVQFPSYFELCRLTWRQYLARFDLILVLTVLIALPTHILVSVMLPDIPALAEAETVGKLLTVLTTDPNVWVMVVWNVVSSLVLLFLTTALMVVLRAAYQRKSLRLSAVIRAAVHFYWPVLLTSVLVGTVVLLGLTLLIIPGIVASVYLSLALPIVVWEGIKPLAAMKRSIALVRGQARYVFLYILMTQLWLSLLIWLLISVLPITLTFEIFSLTVGSLITAFETFFEVVLFTACATWWTAAHVQKSSTAKKPSAAQQSEQLTLPTTPDHPA
jgi:hypothetical protein